MLLGTNIKMALANLRAAKLRSLLTMLGVIIGVSSVVITVSLGEGLKKQVVSQINQLGNDLVLVRSGKIISKDSNGTVSGFNPIAALGTSTLTDSDVEQLRKNPSAKFVIPISLITNSATYDSKEINNAFVLSSGADIPSALNHKVNYGAFFLESELNENYAVIGERIAEDLFGEFNPIGKTMKINGNDFIVRGVFEQFEGGALNAGGTDYNSAIFIPFNTGKRITDNKAQIMEIIIKGSESSNVNQVVADAQKTLFATHQNQENFTVLKQDELLQITDDVLIIVTVFISGIAAISLIVGGIGIMNIMLVSVTERTREIGIRKAVGATNSQILGQFLTEGVILSVVGGAIGILVALGVNVLLRITTDLTPVVTPEIVALAAGVSIIIGSIFSITPALKAARKDPIQALRNE